MEIIIVVIVIGILAGLAIPRLILTMERAKNKEAVTALKAIAAGQKIYRLHYGRYFETGNAQEIERVLGVNVVETDWDFSLFGLGNPYYAWIAQRKIGRDAGFLRQWEITNGSVGAPFEPCCEGSLFACPYSRCR